MGLLDDAIREHLELKRRRGADPEEVARQEDEALGDPRSGEFVRPDDAPTAEPAAVESQPEPAAVEPEPEPEPESEPEIQAPDPEAAAPVPRDEPWLSDDDRPEPVVSEPAAEVAPSEPEVVAPDEEPPAEEDVLEETPDFLQETPEHDRLWFEQKPPRDFDFDK
jgi:hypothetical protein